MRHELLILRHAKSSWDSLAGTDFDRPLAPRGTRDATRLGRWLADERLMPDRALCSSALRARETVELALGTAPATPLELRDSLYHAGLVTLVNSIREQPDEVATFLLVGHNPGMDQLLVYLCEDEVTFTRSGKLMTTAALAHIECDCAWADLAPEYCKLTALRRPRDAARGVSG